MPFGVVGMPSSSKRLPVAFYETSAGAEPVREWLTNLSADDKRVIGFDLARLEFGWPVGMPLCRALGSGLWEVRSSLPRGRIARSSFLHRCRRDVAAARVREKDPQDSRGRSRVGAKENERGGRMNRRRKPHHGSLFQDWLKSEGIQEEANAAAIKAVVAYQLAMAMKERGLSKAQMARQLQTSRSQIDRILDPENDTVSIATLSRAAELVGRKLTLRLN
jgi:predicted XRE-type DNA-binding protein